MTGRKVIQVEVYKQNTRPPPGLRTIYRLLQWSFKHKDQYEGGDADDSFTKQEDEKNAEEEEEKACCPCCPWIELTPLKSEDISGFGANYWSPDKKLAMFNFEFTLLITVVTVIAQIYYVRCALKFKDFKPFTIQILVGLIGTVSDFIADQGMITAKYIPQVSKLGYVNLVAGIACIYLTYICFAGLYDMKDEASTVDYGNTYICLVMSITDLVQGSCLMALIKNFSEEDNTKLSKEQTDEEQYKLICKQIDRNTARLDSYSKWHCITVLTSTVAQIIIMIGCYQMEDNISTDPAKQSDYVAIVITLIIAVDALLDTIADEAAEGWFPQPEDGEDRINAGVILSFVFKMFHNALLGFIGIVLFQSAVDVFQKENADKQDNFNEMIKTENWFGNATKIGDYFDANGDGKVDGPDPKIDGHYCVTQETSFSYLYSKTSETKSKNYCTKYTYDAKLGKGKFAKNSEYDGIITDAAFGWDKENTKKVNDSYLRKINDLWGDIPSIHCPNQCHSPYGQLMKAQRCIVGLCQMQVSPKMTRPYTVNGKTAQMGSSVGAQEEKEMNELYFDMFDIVFLFSFFIILNFFQVGEAFVNITMSMRWFRASYLLAIPVFLVPYVALVMYIPELRPHLVLYLPMSISTLLCPCFLYSKTTTSGKQMEKEQKEGEQKEQEQKVGRKREGCCYFTQICCAYVFILIGIIYYFEL